MKRRIGVSVASGALSKHLAIDGHLQGYSPLFMFMLHCEANAGLRLKRTEASTLM